jgi:class 3 adenylate cyclase/tetratricopeptide (TPR) repeat protein
MSTETSKLAAVLFADMVGYSSRRQGLALELRREMMVLVHQCLSAGEGRLIKTAGDEIFVELRSGSIAIAFAQKLHEAVSNRNATQSRDRQFLLRIGINSGEVAMEGDDLFGGIVNIAKRAEQLAAPEGICLAEQVWLQADGSLQKCFVPLGRIPVKAQPPRQVFYHCYGPQTTMLGKIGHQLRVRFGRLSQVAAAFTIMLFLMVGLRLAWPETNPDTFVAGGMKQIERYDLPNHIDNAISSFKKARKLDPKSARAVDGLAWAEWLQYLDTGDMFLRGEAEKHANEALTLNTNVIYSDVVLGLIAEESGQATKAVEHLLRANNNSLLQDGALLAQLARVELQAGRTEAALAHARRAEAKAGQSWNAWHQLGVFWFRDNNLTNSVLAFLQAARSSPPSIVSTEQAIFTLCRSGRAVEALELARPLMKQSDNPEALSVYGNVCLVREEYLPAYQAFKRASDLCPSNYLYFGNAGLALFMAQTNGAEWTALLKNEAIPQAHAKLDSSAGNAQVRVRLASYEAALADESSGLPAAQRHKWNDLALADADSILNQNPFSPEILAKLQTVYDILDRTDRVMQCEARLKTLKGAR